MSANHVCHHDYGSGSTLVQSLIRQGCRIERSEGMLYLVDAFWTARQRQAHSLHEISYRGCFKPQLPAFFIERLTTIGDRVFDPFMGRGTTPLQAALMQRHAAGSDQNRLCVMLSRPRLCPPTDAAVRKRLAQIDLAGSGGCRGDRGRFAGVLSPGDVTTAACFKKLSAAKRQLWGTRCDRRLDSHGCAKPS